MGRGIPAAASRRWRSSTTSSRTRGCSGAASLSPSPARSYAHTCVLAAIACVIDDDFHRLMPASPLPASNRTAGEPSPQHVSASSRCSVPIGKRPLWVGTASGCGMVETPLVSDAASRRPSSGKGSRSEPTSSRPSRVRPRRSPAATVRCARSAHSARSGAPTQAPFPEQSLPVHPRRSDRFQAMIADRRFPDRSQMMCSRQASTSPH